MQPVAPQAEPQKKEPSPWLYVGIGCGTLLVLAVGVMLFGPWFASKKNVELQSDMASPVARTEKVKKILGAQTLPDGYHAVMSLTVPAVMDTALLSTRSPEASRTSVDPSAEERVFMYFFFKSASMNDQEALREYLEGRSDDASVLTRNKIRIGQSVPIGRGALELESRRVLYLALRGELSATGAREGPGLYSLLFIECPGQPPLRLGIWMAPDPSPETPLEQLELKGTPADPEAMRAFVSHFNPCQES